MGDLLGDRADYRHLDEAAPPASTAAGDADTGSDGGLPVALSRLESGMTAGGRRPGSSPHERDRVFNDLVRSFTAWAHTVSRRGMLPVLGRPAAAAAVAPLIEPLPHDEQVRVVSALQVPSRVDAAVIGHIEDVLWHCMRQDDALGPQAALDTVLAQRNLAHALLPECPAALRPRLLSLFSNLSRCAGWCSFDLADFDSAWYFYEQARSAAHEAENTALSTHVLCNMSQLATWQGRPRVGIDHAVAAQAWATRIDDAPLQAYTFDVAARAYALDGQRGACLTELEKAGEVVSTVSRSGSGPSLLGGSYGPGAFDSTQSLCFLQLADTTRAIQAANASPKLLDASGVRNIAFTRFDLVGAYTQSREPRGRPRCRDARRDCCARGPKPIGAAGAGAP